MISVSAPGFRVRNRYYDFRRTKHGRDRAARAGPSEGRVLFANYESGQSEDVLAQICNELEIHTTLEEELVYPRLAQLDRDSSSTRNPSTRRPSC